MDVEHSGEMLRLSQQARLLFQHSSEGLFPADLDPSRIHDVLDIACGPGTWVLDVAQSYPHLQASGIDLSQAMVAYASSLAETQKIVNARFQVMNATQPLDFPDGSFDLINARFIFGFMPTATWPLLLRECQRLLRPGGMIVLTEGELPLTNSLGVERLSELFAQALVVAKQSFSPDGRQLGITPMLTHLLHDAGYQHTQRTVHTIDFSAGTDLHMSYFYPNYVTGFQLAEPFLLKMNVTTHEEVQRLYRQMISEVHSNQFCGITYILTVWGRKP